jgi:uncharacterized protein (DUF2336 family)
MRLTEIGAMSAALATDDILLLAQSRAPADREQLMLALVDLCARAEAGGGVIDPSVHALMNSVFLQLVGEAERDIRRALAERLATAAWAPRGLINVLALDDIEIARPVIAKSPVLEDDDLMRLFAMAAIEHQIEVASRPAIGAAVVDTILKAADPAVLSALAANDTAEIDAKGMKTLLAASERNASIRSPLVRHPRLTTDMAEQLYAWVGQSLRSAIVSRFRVDADALDRAMAAAVRDVHGAGAAPAAGADRSEEREMERRLVAKLKASGQLRPGYLVRALRDQRLGLFIAAMAELIGVDMAVIDRAISSQKPDLLALACTAAGVDRSAFPTILSLVRELNRNLPGGGSEDMKRAQTAFQHDPSLALRALRQMAA